MLTVIANDIQQSNAGVRQRIKPLYANENQDVSFVEIRNITTMAQLESIAASSDAVVMVKPSSEYFWIIAFILKNRFGVPLIIDIFDNYLTYAFSLNSTGYTFYLRKVFELSDLVVCSTDHLKSKLIEFGIVPETILVVSDPHDSANSPSLSSIERKWMRLYETGNLDVVWFGVASNPHYQSGFADLPLILPILEQLTSFNMTITICSNITGHELLLNEFFRAPYVIRMIEWSMEEEARLLTNAHVVILPTNDTDFVLSKTHNRYTKAISYGCVVLNNEHPQYPNDKSAMLHLLKSMCPLNSWNVASHLMKSNDLFLDKYNRRNLSNKLSIFVNKVARRKTERNLSAPVVLLFCPRPVDTKLHKLMLSSNPAGFECWSCGVRSPLANLNYDIEFFVNDEPGQLFARASSRACKIIENNEALLRISDGVFCVVQQNLPIARASYHNLAACIREGLFFNPTCSDLTDLLALLLPSTASILTMSPLSFRPLVTWCYHD